MEFNRKKADLMYGQLGDGGLEGRVKKAIRRYRDHQTEDTRAAALAAIGTLDENKRTELRQAARA